jgi:hypothetical protein
MALYLKKLAVFNTNSSEVTTLVNVMEGAEGSAVFGYNQTDSALVVANGQKQQFKQTHTVSLSILPPTGTSETQMNAILASPESAPVKLAGMSDDVFLLWDEQAYLVQKDEYGDTLTRNLNMTKDATIGYRGDAPFKKKAVYSGGNLLALYDVLSGDGDVLNGFTTFGSITASCVGAVQSITRGADATAAVVSRPILFPFNGESLTLSMFVNSANAGYSFGIDFFDETETFISTSSESTTGATSRKSMSAVVPSGTAFISVFFRPGATTGNTLVFQAPALRLAGLTAYTN